MKKKSILLIGWFFYPKLGGVESIMLSQAKYFLELNFNVAVLTKTVDGLSKNDNLGGIKIFRRDFMNSGKEYLLNDIQEELIAILEEIKPDIVHFHNGSYPAASLDMNAGAKNIKNIFEILKSKNIIAIDHAHNAQLKSPEITKQLRDLNWDYVVCVSNFVKDMWQKFGTNAKKIKVVYNGINLNHFQNIRPNRQLIDLKTNNEKIIFFPARVMNMSQGTVSKQKNFFLLIEAAAILLKKQITNFKIVAIKNNSEKNSDIEAADLELSEAIEKTGLKDTVYFISSVPTERMPEFYAGADIICAPSINETFGLVYLEGMASGKVVIASNTGGPKEYIKDGVNGFLVDPNSPEELAKKLETIINDQVLVEKIKKNALITTKEFSIDKMMREIEEIYKEVT